MNAAGTTYHPKRILFGCLAILVLPPVALILLWSAQNWSYTRFCWRSQAYYAQVAAACDEILAAPGPVPRVLKRRDLPPLPPVLRDLDITYMVVHTNMVDMTIGSGLVARLIIWKLSDDGSAWNLIRASPETRTSKVIYTRMVRPVTKPDL